MAEITDIQKKIKDKFATDVSAFRMEQDILTFEVSPSKLHQVICLMHEDGELNFNFLTDVCAVHYPDNQLEKEFAVVYLLHNWVDNIRVRVKAFITRERLEIDTITDIFAAANWMERETYDFYGVNFIGHPNLKRILNDVGMTSFPMRKEYPMEDSQRTDKDDRFFGREVNNNQRKQSK